MPTKGLGNMTLPKMKRPILPFELTNRTLRVVTISVCISSLPRPYGWVTSHHTKTGLDQVSSLSKTWFVRIFYIVRTILFASLHVSFSVYNAFTPPLFWPYTPEDNPRKHTQLHMTRHIHTKRYTYLFAFSYFKQRMMCHKHVQENKTIYTCTYNL